MSYFSKVNSMYNSELQINNPNGGDVNITSTTGQVKVNGIVPSGGGGASLPITGNGDITLLTGSVKVKTGAVEVDVGNIVQGGTGKITSGSGGLESNGEIVQIGAYDLTIGRDIYFFGNDIYHSQGNPVINTPYKTFKGLAGLNDNQTFVGSNIFSQTTEFGTINQGAYPIRLNSNGDIQSVNLNNSTLIQCGNINAGNGGDNRIRAKEFYTRTSENNSLGREGWSFFQQLPSNPADPVDKILQIRAGEVGGLATITATDFTGTEPSIVLDPQTQADGGKIVASSLHVGVNDASDFVIEKPKSGAETNNLLVKVGSTNGTIKIQNQSGTNLMLVEEASATNKGRLYIGEGVFFGTTGIHNNITESGNNLLIDQNDAASETQIRDNSNNPIVSFRKTAVVVSNPLPIQFGAYSFIPIQYKLNRTLTIAAAADTTNFTNMAFNCQSDTWTNVNTNQSISMYNAALEGYYKVTITQTALSSAGNFNRCDLMFDYVYHLSIQTAPDIDVAEPAFNYQAKPTNQARPTIRIDHLNTPVQSQPVFVLYQNQSAGETMPIEVRLTKLDF